jgi:hypothetical protein
MPVMPSRAFLRLFHGTKLVAEGEVAFSTAFEESPLGPVHEMRLPPAVVRALDERLMFDAPVLHLEVEGRLPRTVPLRIRDFTEGLRRDVLLVARVPESGRRATVRVVSPRGTPVAGAAVALLPVDGQDGLFGLVRATAGPDGEASFGDLEHRAYAVHAFDPATGSAGTGAFAGDRGAVSLRAPDRVRSLRVSLDGPGRAAWSTITLESVPPGALPSVTVTSRGRDIDVPPLALDAYRARIDAGTKDDGTPTHRLVVDAGELRRTQRLRLPPVER